jgi:hypothetical protein
MGGYGSSGRQAGSVDERRTYQMPGASISLYTPMGSLECRRVQCVSADSRSGPEGRMSSGLPALQSGVSIAGRAPRRARDRTSAARGSHFRIKRRVASSKLPHLKSTSPAPSEPKPAQLQAAVGASDLAGSERRVLSRREAHCASRTRLARASQGRGHLGQASANLHHEAPMP